MTVRSHNFLVDQCRTCAQELEVTRARHGREKATHHNYANFVKVIAARTNLRTDNENIIAVPPLPICGHSTPRTEKIQQQQIMNM